MRWYCCCFNVAKSCLTLWDPMDYSPPGSSVHGISQARILRVSCHSFSMGSSCARGSNLCLLWLLHCQVDSLPSPWGGMISSVQSLSRVQLFLTPWTAARQASLSITNSRSLLKLMSIKSVMPSNHLLLCHPLLLLPSFPASGSFQMSQFFTSGGQSIRVSASASVLPMNIQDWFPLGWTGWIFWLSQRLSRDSQSGMVVYY